MNCVKVTLPGDGVQQICGTHQHYTTPGAVRGISLEKTLKKREKLELQSFHVSTVMMNWKSGCRFPVVPQISYLTVALANVKALTALHMNCVNRMLENASQLYQGVVLQKTGGEESLFAVSKNDVTIVLPVLNEEAGVSVVIDELLENGYSKILVVDGYSTDLTVQAARQKGVTVIEQHGKGKTGAIQTAVEYVKTPYMLIMDGDHTYDPANIERFLTHVNSYDQIIGTRNKGKISWIHRFGNHMISGLFNALFDTFISDVCSGMYLLNSKSARELIFRTTGFSVEVEVLAQMAMNGKVTEVPIHYRKRIGEPKLSTVTHGFDILKTILGLATHYNPVFVFSLVAASAGVPGVVILAWVLWQLGAFGVSHILIGLAAGMLLLFSAVAIVVATVALLLKRIQIRLERLLRNKLVQV